MSAPVPLITRPLPVKVVDTGVLAVSIVARAIALRGPLERLVERLDLLVGGGGEVIFANAECLALHDELEACDLHLLAVEAEVRAILAGPVAP